MPTYADRDELLKTLGYATYRDYLGSPLWAGIRAQVMKAHRGKCKLCGRTARDVHHIAYTRAAVLGENTTALAALCARCHRRVEFSEEGGKRTLHETAETYSRLSAGRCVACGKPARGFPYCRPHYLKYYGVSRRGRKRRRGR